jgi:hypothetical protein
MARGGEYKERRPHMALGEVIPCQTRPSYQGIALNRGLIECREVRSEIALRQIRDSSSVLWPSIKEVSPEKLNACFP